MPNTAPTKAGVRRWFATNVGRQVTTEQVRPDGRTWAPGPRTIERHGTSKFALDGSIWIEPDATTDVLNVSDDAVTVRSYFSDGRIWHTTTYALVKGE
jgi:hypothetical protein